MVTYKKTNIRHSDDDYAAYLYCTIFDVPEDRDDYNPRRILDALNTISEREQKVIELRYRYGKTLSQTGDEFGLTSERIRQIEIKAINKLRHPRRIRDMSIRQIEMERDSYKQKVAEQEAVILELQRKMDRLVIIAEKHGESIDGKETPDPRDILELGIEELEGISIRLFNCLKRAGYNTVCDVYYASSIETLRKIRNLGKRSLDELLQHMAALGFEDWVNEICNEGGAQ